MLEKSGEIQLLGALGLLLGCRISQPSPFWSVGIIHNARARRVYYLGTWGSIFSKIPARGFFTVALGGQLTSQASH